MNKYSKAYAENLLKRFSIEAVNWVFRFDGELKILNGAIHFKVLNGFDKIFALDLNAETFNIEFNSNLTSFNIQHNALKWMEEQNLFEELIGNDQYEAKCFVDEETSQSLGQSVCEFR